MRMKRTLSLWGCVLLLASLVTNLFAQSFDESKLYTIECNNQAGKFMQDNGSGFIVPKTFNKNCFWRLIATENAGCYYVQNATTGRYMQKTSELQVSVKTGDNPVEIYIKNDPAKGENVYGLASTDQDLSFSGNKTNGANYISDYVQGYYANLGGNPNSFWKIVELKATTLYTSTGSEFITASVPVGDAYLLNVESGYWLVNNNRQTTDWNSHAELDALGFDVGLIARNGGYQIDPKMGNNHSLNSSNLYMDTGVDPTTWIFEPASGTENGYYIKSDATHYLHATPDFKIIHNTVDQRHTWKIVTKEERLAMTEAQYATASGSNPVDLTWLIPGSQFNIADERAMLLNGTSGIEAGAAFVSGQTQGNGIREIWSNPTGYDINYTLTNLPAGVYRFTVSGFYRDGKAIDIGGKHAGGTEELRAQYYANNKSLPLMSICAPELTSAVKGCNFKSGNYYVPNNVGDAAIATREGLYVNQPLKVIVDNSGTLTIGVRKTGGVEDDWTILDYWKLQYFGPDNIAQYIALLQASIDAAEAFDTSSTTDALASELQQAINDAKAKLTSDDSDEVEAATLALDDELNKVKAVDVTILRATIPLASADGADTSAAVDFVENGTSASELNNILSALRIARRVANAEKDNNTYAGNAPAAGDFYLYNVGQKRFFCGGDDWGAHAAIGFPGIVVTLEANGESYRLNTHLPNGKDGDHNKEYLNFGGYCDTWNADETSWNFVSQGNGKYTIARSNNGDALLGYSNNTYNRVDTNKSGADNPDNQWILVTKAERDALYEAAAAVTDQPATAVDVSYLIKSPNFSQREDVSAWTLTNSSIWGRGSNHPDFAIEAYDQTSASVEQTVSGLKPGTYKLKVQAYYRDGNFDNQANILKNGGELLQLATLFAGNKSALIQNVTVGADKAPGMGRYSEVGNMPDGIDDACLYFQNGLYWAELDNIVVTTANPSITFGARKTEKRNNGDWFVLDNFRLEYLGAYVDLSEVKLALQAKINEATALGTTNIPTFIQDAINDGNNAMNELQDADIIVNATTALTTAINTYNAGKADLTALIQTVAKAQAEGVTGYDNAVADVLAAAADAFASTAAQKLYDVRAARKVKALGKPDDVYTGSAPAAGKVYLYNIGTGMFLGMGSDWNTHAAIDQVGIEVELEASGEGFIMKSAHGKFNDGAKGPYVDTGTDAVFTFTPVSGQQNVYTIKQGDLVLGWNPNADTNGKHYWNTIANTAGADVSDANFQWKVITADERAALEATASSTKAVDVSYKIKNASLFRKPGYDMWEKTGGARVSTTDDNDGNRAADYAWEFFNTDNFSFTQTVTGLKPGYYKVSVQGFYRDGNGAYQAGVVNENGELLQKAYLVGGNAQALLPNVASAMDVVPGLTDIQATDRGNMPNWPNSSIEFFEHGAYLTTVDAKVGSNGELTIGVKKDEKPHGDDWVVLDNFRLYYLGNPYTSMSILGDFTGGWDFTDDKHMTQDANDPAIWTLVIDNFKVDKDWYEYKATANDTWGVYEKPMQGSDPANQNWKFGTETSYPYGYYKLIFTLNTETHELTLQPIQKTVVTIAEDETFVPADQTDVTIVLNRTLTTNNTWNTFCVPFNISNEDLKAQFGDGVAVAGFKDKAEGENSTIEFNTMDTPAITANVPVLLKPGIISNDNKYVFGGDIVAVAGEAKVPGTNFDFVGTFAASTPIEEGNYFMSANKLYKSAGATTIAGTRAFLKAIKAGARIDKFLLDGEDVTTSISTMISEQGTMDNVFDLQGRKVNDQTKKGVYIQNGKKVVVK